MAEFFQPRPQPDFWDLLFQGEIWIPKGCDPIRLVDMTPEHRANLRNWLRNRAIRIAVAYEVEPLEYMHLFNGDMAQFSLECEANQRTFDVERAGGPDRWLADQPLMKKLIELDRKPALTAWEV